MLSDYQLKIPGVSELKMFLLVLLKNSFLTFLKKKSFCFKILGLKIKKCIMY